MRASIIVPTDGKSDWNDSTLEGTARAVKRLGGVELVVVDNGVSSNAALRAACESQGVFVRYIAEYAPGSTAARHRGADEARGNVLVFTDDDVETSPETLDALIQAIESGSADLAGGPSLPSFTCSIPAWFWSFVEPAQDGGWCCGWLSLLDIGRSVTGIDPAWLWSLNLAVRASKLRELGGFNPDLLPSRLARWQGDGETGLGIKVSQCGAKTAYLQEAVVHHRIGEARLTPAYFQRRAFFQGICTSFSSIRSGTPPELSPPDALPWRERPADRWFESARPVWEAFTEGFNRGWRFHQREAARDPVLLEWVRRPNYWGADLRGIALEA